MTDILFPNYGSPPTIENTPYTALYITEATYVKKMDTDLSQNEVDKPITVVHEPLHLYIVLCNAFNISVVCRLPSENMTFATWSINGHEIKSDGHYHIDANSDLRVSMAKSSDIGEYKYQAHATSDADHLFTFLVYEAVLPVLSFPRPIPSPLILILGTNNSLPCRVDKSDSSISVNWLKNGHRLNSSKYIDIQRPYNIVAVYFQGIKKDDEGNYTCLATSIAGNTSISVTVMINNNRSIANYVFSLIQNVTFQITTGSFILFGSLFMLICACFAWNRPSDQKTRISVIGGYIGEIEPIYPPSHSVMNATQKLPLVPTFTRNRPSSAFQSLDLTYAVIGSDRVKSEDHYAKIIKKTSSQVQFIVKSDNHFKTNILNLEFGKSIGEGPTLDQISHTHVMNLIDISISDDKVPVYTISDYMTNGDLLTYLLTEYVATSECLQFAIQIAEGMEYLHSMNILHRNLAARNCMLDKELRVKIGDYGLAAECKGENMCDKNVEDRDLPLRWMAIEVLEHQNFTMKSDVWSYGVVLWELMTRGDLEPYESSDNAQIYKFLKKGYRLGIPHKCPPKFYKTLYLIMIPCWRVVTDFRPSFPELVVLVREFCESIDCDDRGK